MEEEKDYKEVNKEAWNKKTEIHYNSDFYDNASFLAGKNSLNEIEIPLLGDLEGKSVLHLQCHFGQDTISLNRMGASSVGVDLSDRAIEKAIELAEKARSDAQFICSDIYDLVNHLDDTFDIVFTSYGTIGWLPDLDKWASVVNRYLKPGGRFVIAEFHPVVWMFDDDFQDVAYSYFNTGPIIESETGTYTDMDIQESFNFVSWNHGLGEVVNSLINQGLNIKSLTEYDYSPYDCFRHTEKIADRKYRIKHLGAQIPMVYALVAEKTSHNNG